MGRGPESKVFRGLGTQAVRFRQTEKVGLVQDFEVARSELRSECWVYRRKEMVGCVGFGLGANDRLDGLDAAIT